MGWVGRTGRRTRKRVEPASGLEAARNLRSRNQQKSVGNMTGLSCFVRDTSRLHSHRHARSAAPPVDPTGFRSSRSCNRAYVRALGPSSLCTPVLCSPAAIQSVRIAELHSADSSMRFAQSDPAGIPEQRGQRLGWGCPIPCAR